MQCHMCTIFIRPLVDVADDGVPPKLVVDTMTSDVATAGTYVDDVTSHVNKLFGGLGFKNVFVLMSPATHGCFRKYYPWFSGVC